MTACLAIAGVLAGGSALAQVVDPGPDPTREQQGTIGGNQNGNDANLYGCEREAVAWHGRAFALLV